MASRCGSPFPWAGSSSQDALRLGDLLLGRDRALSVSSRRATRGRGREPQGTTHLPLPSGVQWRDVPDSRGFAPSHSTRAAENCPVPNEKDQRELIKAVLALKNSKSSYAIFCFL